MPNPNMLYAVTAVVVALLAVWIVLVFKNAKEPWAKPGLPVKDSVPSKYSTIVDEPAEAAATATAAPPAEKDGAGESKESRED